MVLQRIQSVWLLVAAVCTLLFCFLPVASLSMTALDATSDSATLIQLSDNWALLAVGIVTALLVIVNIFSFKDTRKQKRMTIIGIILMAVLGCCAAFMVYNVSSCINAEIEWLGSMLLLLGAIIFSILAYRGIVHDEKLLRAADRLR